MTTMDDINGRMGSEAPSSSSSDFYATDSPKKQPNGASAGQSAMDPTGQVDTTTDAPMDDVDEDSSAEMDLSDSRSPSPEPASDGITQRAPRDQPVALPQPPKRKLSEDNRSANGTAQISAESSKKPRLSTAVSEERRDGAIHALNLPPELWQQIFLHLSPNNLARCLRVCWTLKKYLTEMTAKPAANKAVAKDLSRVRVFDSEAVWAHSRKLFSPSMPRPLARLTELQMLQLIGNMRCQFCGRPPMPLWPTSPFNCGPGADGVRVFWPFGIRSCGQCIEAHTARDVDVLTSKAASLRQGLPYCFLTPDFHFVPEIQRTQFGGIPAHLRVAKVYYHPDVQNIVEEYSNAVNLGAGAAEEWKKGLIARGKDAMADAARWEQWEAQLPSGTHPSAALREYDVPLSTSDGQAYSTSAVSNGTQPNMAMNGSYSMAQPVQYSQPTPFTQPPHLLQSMYMPQDNSQAPSFGPYPANSLPAKPAKARSAQDVEDTVQGRKAYIARRCRELSPPLDPRILPHMQAYQATVQIAQPMTDDFWESFLKPRILAEREAAEAAEQARQDQLIWLQAAVPHSVQDEPYTRPAKEIYDKEYELAQEPLRKRLGEYADDFINEQWKGGELDKSNSPVFAVEIIEYVDRRYREDKLAGRLPPTDPLRGFQSGTALPEPFLSLSNMKWVYDNKIRPLTDRHGRELFLCSGCPVAKPPKWLAFEGLIQHYGAKHTTDFSHGNVVVRWPTAEWPSELPFIRNPTHYMKQEKKAFESKGNGRSRRTPQINNGPYNAPGSGKLLSESPFFSGSHQSPPAAGGYYQPAPEYAGYDFSQMQQDPAPYGWPQQMKTSNDQTESTDEAQLNMLCSDISAIWDSLDGVKDKALLDCVRVQTTLHHAVTRFETRFGKIPNLDLITDVLATKPEVKPVKEVHGLACKICVATQMEGFASYPSYFIRIQGVKLYSTSSLVSHFNIMHLGQGRKSMDWIANMIEVPEPEIVSRLVRAPGMDDDKLATIAEAFPNAFSWPLPKIGYVSEDQAESQLAQKILDRHFKKKGDAPKKKKKGQHGANGTPAREESEPLPEAREDEYDPRRPVALPTDNRAARTYPPVTSPQSAAAFNISSETLAAISQLNASTLQGQQSVVDRRAERSPSVGRADPTPNISEILAQITGNQTATPPDTTSRSSSQPKTIHGDPYAPSHRVSPRRYVDERPASSRYTQPAGYRASAEPLPRYEGHEALPAHAYNARQFEENRGQPYTEPAYPHTSRTPPRYRPVYEDTPQYSPQYAQPPQYAQAPYRPQPPAKYVQVHADRDRYQAPTYQYAPRPPPEHKYVDEYGRELKLVPVEPAPPPVQYAPYPVEQQYARHAPPVATAYAGSPPAPQYSPHQYDDRRAVYYEPHGSGVPPADHRYGYEEVSRGSVPRR